MRHRVGIYVRNVYTMGLKPAVREAHSTQDRIGAQAVISKKDVESVELNTSFEKHAIWHAGKHIALIVYHNAPRVKPSVVRSAMRKPRAARSMKR